MSPWPILGSFSVMSTMLNFYMVLNSLVVFNYLLVSLGSLFMVLFQWWRDVLRESNFQGMHSSKVRSGLYLGMVMFILSEVMFFFSFFFGYFFSSLNPSIDIGGCWPPSGIQSLNFLGIPFLNTVILISSGISITWGHHAMLNSDFSQSKISISLTILLGFLFLYLQALEYFEISFSMADSVYGSLFFIATGFHGIHVFIGVLFIFVSFLKMFLIFPQKSYVCFEMAAWYWHFVDVVWLFLFISIYWWGC
uniref:Cytochrome c oxidase subunit 3 n=1 Tax=Falcolipeurus suturalis TaxID=2839002 RepID=A0A8F8VUG4_9NEOP|nr:cytochrome c oxidase subunit 3 [Falcolipeurus suturalis]